MDRIRRRAEALHCLGQAGSCVQRRDEGKAKQRGRELVLPQAPAHGLLHSHPIPLVRQRHPLLPHRELDPDTGTLAELPVSPLDGDAVSAAGPSTALGLIMLWDFSREIKMIHKMTSQVK